MRAFRVLLLAAGAAIVSVAALVQAQSVAPHTEAVYVNTSLPVPGSAPGLDRYHLVPIPKKSNLVSGWILSVDGRRASLGVGVNPLDSPDLRLGCRLHSLPIGSTLSDPPFSPLPASAPTLLGAFLYRKPSTDLGFKPVMPSAPYHLEEDEQLFLLVQMRNEGTTDLGPVVCAAQIYYLME